MSSFSKNIGPYVEAEIACADRARREGAPDVEFAHLEKAHVLGQASTYWHTRVHLLMLAWAIRSRRPREFFGQLLRIAGAATMTAVGLVPEGNTGGSNVSPLRRLPVKPELQRIINGARDS